MDKFSQKCNSGGGPWDVVANVLDFDTVVTKFKLQSCYYVHFWTNTLEKGKNCLISPAMGLFFYKDGFGIK